MIIVDKGLCTGCGNCEKDCPVEAIKVVNDKAEIAEHCVGCNVCMRSCFFNALTKKEETKPGAVKCTSCPVQCEILPEHTGACKRYTNMNSSLIRNRELVTEVPDHETTAQDLKPLITAVGAGTTYPDARYAPHIVQDIQDGAEVVTVVTEAPLSYSGVKVKIDTNFYIGDEGAKVRRDGRVVGLLYTEEYGSKMISVGGANLLTGKTGFIVAKTIVDISNGEKVTLKVDKGATLELQVGKRPIINGREDERMRIGCGSATVGLFAKQLSQVVDEAIILDYHVVGLLSEHAAGEDVGMCYSGVTPNARRSTRGRYFGEQGDGWGGTNIKNALEAVAKVDINLAKPGMKILVTDTTGQNAAQLTVDADGKVKEVPLEKEVEAVVQQIRDNCEESRVSAIYSGGTGGSARGGVTTYPIKLSQAIHEGEAKLTIGGADTFILPGGGINFVVDVEKVVPKAFTWVPSPATVAPVEYTLKKEKYAEIGGHMEAIIDVAKVRK
ncbi:MAG: 4Fe-4S binding protein [Dehalobacterium sp.]